MQQELTPELLPTGARAIHIFGVNEPGQESGNEAVCRNRTTPWLQDTAGANGQKVWAEKWRPTYRDVVILDENNVKIAAYNLTVHDLSRAANFDTLKTLLIDAATR